MQAPLRVAGSRGVETTLWRTFYMATIIFHTGTWAVAAARRGAAVICDAPVALFVEIVALSASLPLGEHIVLGIVALAVDVVLTAERR